MSARQLACFAVATILAVAALVFGSELVFAGLYDPGGAPPVLRWEAMAAAACAAGLGLVFAVRSRWRLATRHAHVEKALAESERRFRELVELLPEVVFETDARARLVYLNRQARALTGYGDEELARGITSLDMLVPEDRQRARDAIGEIFKGRDLGHNEYTALRKDGTTFPVTVHSQPIVRDGKLVGLRGTVLDISQRKKVEDALRQAKQEAEVASRAKSEFLAAVSHELRTPLNAIIGFSEMIRTGTFGPIGNARYWEYIRDIHESGQHLLELINDILDLSKIESGKDDLARQPVDVAGNARAALKLVNQRAAAGGVKLGIEIEDGLPALEADPRKLKQVFVNLLTNAIKFTGSGGQVTLTGRQIEDGGIELAVSDTGIGIAPEDIPKALSQFGQIRKDPEFAHEGTGLGLPLTKALVEQHGGTLTLESRVGVGTTVRLRFPPACLIDVPSLAALAAAPRPTAAVG
jgi:PAS domain S-box-containing protein